MTVLEKNIAALGATSPRTAARVFAARVEGFARTASSDGSETYARTLTSAQGKRRVEWLGGTSMPQASAGAITASLDAISGGANGLGLSIGSGFEWAAFAARLGRAQVIYVYEPDAALLRMALDICDLSDLLGRRRLVLLAGTAVEAADELAAFLNEQRGFEPPTVLHPLASVIGERRNALLAGGEAIVRRAVTDRQLLVAELYGQLMAGLVGKSNPGGCVALLLTPRYAQERPIQGEAGRRGAVRIAIDTHDTLSAALRLGALVEAAGEGCPRILSDFMRPQLGPIPAEIPIETWLPPLVGPAFWERLPPPQALASRDRIVVHAAYHAERLQSHGIPAAQIECRALTPMFAAGGTAARSPAPFALRHRVALTADLSSTDPVTLDIQLPTHQAVFAAAAELIKSDFLTVHPGMAADLLRRALTRAGVDPRADDPALREPMLRIIRDVLIPALPLLSLAGALAGEGVSLLLIGDWPGIERHVSAAVLADRARLRQVPFAEAGSIDWSDTALFAQVSPEGVMSPFLWEAVAAGVAIVAPRFAAERRGVELLVPEKEFAHPQASQFMATVKSLLRDSARREKLAAAALSRISV